MSKENTPLTKENPDAKKFSINKKEQRLTTENVQKAKKVVVTATGFPEGAGKFAGKTEIYELMEEVLDRGDGFIQVYVGGNLLKINKNSENLRSALELIQEKENVTLLLFSAGALNLEKIEIPDNVKRIVFISPMTGQEAIQPQQLDLFTKLLVKIYSIPTLEEYFSSVHVKNIIDRAKKGEVKIYVLTTLIDSYIKPEETRTMFKKHFPKANILEPVSGDHAPDDISKIIETLYSKTEKTKNSLT